MKLIAFTYIIIGIKLLIFLDQIRNTSFIQFELAVVIYLFLLIVEEIGYKKFTNTKVENFNADTIGTYKYLIQKPDYFFLFQIAFLILTFFTIQMQIKWFILIVTFELILAKYFRALKNNVTHQIVLHKDSLDNIQYSTKTYKISKFKNVSFTQNEIQFKYGFENITINSNEIENGQILIKKLKDRLKNRS